MQAQQLDNMSTDYDIFFYSECPVTGILKHLDNIDGVTIEHEGSISIAGLMQTTIREIDGHWRETMREEYGPLGICVTHLISGTHDKVEPVDDVMERIFRCAASILKASPDFDLAVMRNGESFYMRHAAGSLQVSPVYLDLLHERGITFVKPYKVSPLDY